MGKGTQETGAGVGGWGGGVAVFPKEMETLFQLATAIWGASSHQLEIIYEWQPEPGSLSARKAGSL